MKIVERGEINKPLMEFCSPICGFAQSVWVILILV